MNTTAYTFVNHAGKLSAGEVATIVAPINPRKPADTIFFPMGCYRTVIPFSRSNQYPQYSSPFDFLKVMTFTSFRGSCDVNIDLAGYNFTFVDLGKNTANIYYVMFDESFLTPSIEESKTAKVGLSFRECGLVIVKNWKEKEA